ncbi:BgTH12-01502 [Blumeria graminis f. sp. triticale]|uniref:Bgt-3662 n=3 Tax=Blumeria graminis TaxID=34373 RepID=A0A061HLV6_BLUGR|nr:hypothetical protein BGT96224_3662 [Blumeria graminis f. sp. tritici 96224]CAD6501250.1 BgTH12-01502 [Blumeria graminis f. sp. triticale]VDB83667.1 Bgt-3662 [Blumeria graminis f. sp. tritici]
MAVLYPLCQYALVLPLLALASLPTILLATITTILSIVILLLITIFLYINLALAVVPQCLLERHSSTATPRPSLRHGESSTHSCNSQNKKRNCSRSITSTSPPHNLGLCLGLDASRDYEGVGGWELSRAQNERADCDLPWMQAMPSLELPGDYVRRHHRNSKIDSTDSEHRVSTPSNQRF